MEILINGRAVPVEGEHAELAVNSDQFRDWASHIDPRFFIRSIHIQLVDTKEHHGSTAVRFIKFKADVVDSLDRPLAGIVFMRGGSVGILFILECEGELYTLLTLQPRFPGGDFAFPEIIAGTIEGDGTFAGAAVRELEEETGIVIKAEDLFDLIVAVYGDRFKGVYPTVGGSDEFLRLFLCQKSVTREYLNNLQGKCTGLFSENERITLKVIKLSDLVTEAPDAKALSALMLYQTAKALGKI